MAAVVLSENSAEVRRPTARVYVDGLNLYRRLLGGHPEHKWLDLEALMDRLLPEYDVVSLSYFTAVIKPLPGKDLSSPQRQQAYLRAVQAGPRTTVFLGKFRVDRRVMPLHPTELDEQGEPRRVVVKKAEEKGSDVALASRLLVDAVKRPADLYAVLTNDSDLVMPLVLAQTELGRVVGLISPMEEKRASNELKRTRPVLHRRIAPEDLAACQYPDVVAVADGIVTRPAKWPRHSEGPSA